jgi:hypothetical protein
LPAPQFFFFSPGKGRTIIPRSLSKFYEPEKN